MKNKADKSFEDEYFENMTHNINTTLVMVSKGKAWIENNEEEQTVRLTGQTEEDIKQAGVIQTMFGKTKNFPMEKVQKALQHFGWKLYLIKDGQSINFHGDDRFLLVQIAWCLGTMKGEKYAELYRKAVNNKERIYF